MPMRVPPMRVLPMRVSSHAFTKLNLILHVHRIRKRLRVSIVGTQSTAIQSAVLLLFLAKHFFVVL